MKKLLPRYQVDRLTRKQLEDGAWKGTHPDYKSMIRGVRHVMWNEPGHATVLAPISEIPDAELVMSYLSYARKELRSSARASDLDLFEANPDRPDSSILWADAEILFTTHSGWCLGYVQPSDHDLVELEAASRYAQVMAAFNRNAPTDQLLRSLHDPENYREWKQFEQEGRVIHDAMTGEVLGIRGGA